MFTAYTFEDWQAHGVDKRGLIQQIITAYKGSDDFATALDAQRYFNSVNTAINSKFIVQLDAREVDVPVTDQNGNPIEDARTGKPATTKRIVKDKIKVEGTRLSSAFFFRFVTQQAQHLLGNGVTLTDVDKTKLGRAFDTLLSQMGEHAIVDGVCWGFWNNDHIEIIRAVVDGMSGGVALVSERDSMPRVFVQFWQIDAKKPMYVRVFETDGVTMYKTGKDSELVVLEPKRAYKLTKIRDAQGEQIIGGGNYTALPVVPLYANPERRSELTQAIKSKIDAFDRIASDFGDNLEMANDVFWVLNNFGGSTTEALNTLKQIRELRTVINVSDGTGSGSTAEPHSFEVPHEARKVALDILRQELYRDAMALDMTTLSGATLSTEAIEMAAKELNLKCDRFEWQVFAFVQKVLWLQGIDTEGIAFKRQSITNATQVIENIYRAAEDLDQETRLKLNPMIADDDIEKIMQATAVEKTTGLPSVEMLQEEIDRARQSGQDDGQGGEENA